MSDDTSSQPKKLNRVHTFADDVARVRGKDAVDPSLTPVPKKQKKHRAPVSLQHDTDALMEDHASARKPATKKSGGASMDVPPFHYIRATSPEENVYDETHEIPDMESLKHETVHTNAPKDFIAQKQPRHNLDINTDNIVDPNTRDSLLTAKDDVFDTHADVSEGEGSIVTDQKGKRFHLFPAIGAAMKRWFGRKKKTIVAKTQKSKHTIAKADRRKEVIVAAAQQAKHAPDDDYKKVSDRLKSVERVTKNTGLEIKDAAETPAPTWQHHTDKLPPKEEVKGTLESALEGEGVGAAVDLHIPRPEASTKTTVAPQEANQPPSQSATLPSEPTAETNDTAAAIADEEKLTTPKFNRAPVPEARRQQIGQPVRETQGTPLLTLAAVAMTATILGVGITVWWFTRDTADEVVAIVATPSLIATENTTAVELSSDKVSFFNNLITAGANSGGVAELYPVIGDALALPESVLTVLRLEAPGSFTRAVTDISFGFYERETPFIVMKITSFDVAFGGTLAWESFMLADLAPLFGTPESTTVIDSRTNNRDVRVLVGLDTTDKLVYGFLDKNTILITKNRQAYTAIAPLVE